ncbi:hypothetical protein [Nitrospirillum iridis]|uniref:Uncharacterized protein n=1 Tax=Nitrospirillum iridis TaxID=765888 RepID=A0A7X0EEV6_9PROT|nr:hypothetical protein [Nitrospirillum iridis]MBB6252436.1 hypothetical protein [Nitrospirillum iridis]
MTRSVLTGVLACAIHIVMGGHVSAAENAPAPPNRGRAEWLLRRVKTLADEGAVLDQAVVFELFALKTKNINRRDFGPHDFGCSEISDEYLVKSAGWYRSTPEGRVQLLGGGLMNPAVMKFDRPHVSYWFHDYSKCINNNTYEITPSSYREADVAFGEVNAFACIKPELLRKLFPSIGYSFGSDSYGEWRYVGKWDDHAQTTITFDGGPNCVINVTVKQTELSGKRFERALARFLNCRKQVRAAFCQGRQSFSEDDPLYRELQTLVATRCQPIESYHEAEPWSGETPPELPILGREICGRDDPDE